MAGLSLEPPKAMNFNAKNLADNWKKFKRNFRVYYDAAELKKKGSTQVAILLDCLGEGASDRFEKFKFSDSGQDKRDNIEAVLETFRNLCEPRKNVLYDTHIFFQRKQLLGESFECFLNALKTDAKKCEFGELENRFICMQIILTTKINWFRTNCSLILISS